MNIQKEDNIQIWGITAKWQDCFVFPSINTKFKAIKSHVCGGEATLIFMPFSRCFYPKQLDIWESNTGLATAEVNLFFFLQFLFSNDTEWTLSQTQDNYWIGQRCCSEQVMWYIREKRSILSHAVAGSYTAFKLLQKWCFSPTIGHHDFHNQLSKMSQELTTSWSQLPNPDFVAWSLIRTYCVNCNGNDCDSRILLKSECALTLADENILPGSCHISGCISVF